MDTLKDINISRNQIASFENTDFAAFTRLWVLDISANGIDKFPIELTKCQNLRELRLINNNISEVPAVFFDEENIRNSLQIFIMNKNPLKELHEDFTNLRQLEVLGVAFTYITKLPPQIIKLKKLRQIFVQDTPLKTPKLVLALRGVHAIFEYFQSNKNEESKVAEAQREVTKEPSNQKS